VCRSASLVVVALLTGCRVLTTGLEPGPVTSRPDAGDDDAGAPRPDAIPPGWDVAAAPGLTGTAFVVGCSDGSREGFRDLERWPSIAGCAGAFTRAGLVGSPEPRPSCGLQAGDTGREPSGTGCSAADLCAEHWHVCQGPAEVGLRSPSGCEGCTVAGEPRFFAVAGGASAMGICSPDREAANDLHGCGGYGQPESPGCAPLTRRMGFADCLTTNGVWSCGGAADSTREAAIVTKPAIDLGGVLCCRD
jgi:hypothetical protein